MTCDRDIGRQVAPVAANERTALAWNRSALSAGLLGAVVIRYGAAGDLPLAAAFAVGVALLVAAVTAWVYGERAYRARPSAAFATAVPLARPRALRLVSVSTAVAAVCAVVLVLAGRL